MSTTFTLTVHLLCLSVLGLLVGCSGEPPVWSSYPGNMGILSKYHEPIEILGCDGLGVSQPFGTHPVIPEEDNFPNMSYRFPRIPGSVHKFTMRWKNVTSGETYSQLIEFPKHARGSRGKFLFKLDKDNVWSCTLMKSESWKEPLEPK